MELNRPAFFSRVALGFIVAATGVGAGDLITASLAGSSVGVVILWAAWAGALLKFFLNEGLARFQLATNRTILEGWFFYLPRLFPWIFFLYFLLWSFYVGSALVNACGVAGVGFFSFGNPGLARIIWGVFHSGVGLVVVWRGGFPLFQRLMTFLTAAMVVTVLLSLLLISPDWVKVIKGLLWPSFPPHGLSWLIGVMGGVGGTVTIICYNYWLREKGRKGFAGVKECREDLGVGYGLTAFFGIAMIIIGSKITVSGRGDEVALQLAGELGKVLGPAGKWLFLLGFWSAVFSSLVGVWQGVPYIFADFLRLTRKNDRRRKRGRGEGEASTGSKGDEKTWSPKDDLTRTLSYRLFLIALAFLPLLSLRFTVQRIQLVYAVLGALFMPFLALTLLLLNNRREVIPPEFRNTRVVNFWLGAGLVFFTYVGLREIVVLMAPIFK